MPCESHNSLGVGERYHEPLKRIYKKLKEEEPDMEPVLRLSIAVHSLNNTASPEGLIPSLLVFGSVLKIPLGNIPHLASNQRKRFTDMESARKQMERIVAIQRLKMAGKLRTKQMDVFSIMPGSDVLVYREKKKIWDGPFKLIRYDNYKTAYVRTGKLIEPFSITAVKQFESADNFAPSVGGRVEVYWPKDDKYYSGKIESYNMIEDTHHVLYGDGDKEDLNFKNERWKLLPKKVNFTGLMKRVSRIADTFFDKNSTAEVNFTRSSKKGNESESHNNILETVANPMDPRFTESARDEIQGLLSRGSFKIVAKEDVPENCIVLKSRVHHVVKGDENENKKYKTRLVIQGHKDPDKGSIVT